MPNLAERFHALPKAPKMLLIIVFGTIGAAIMCLVFLGLLILLIQSIGRSFSCDYFPIDNSEMIAQVDVSDTDEYTCDYFEDGRKQVRNVLFIISKDVKRPRYISFNNFRKVAPRDSLIFKYQQQWTRKIDSIRQHTVLYVKYETYISERKNHYEYLYVLDTAAGTVWSEIIKTPPL